MTVRPRSGPELRDEETFWRGTPSHTTRPSRGLSASAEWDATRRLRRTLRVDDALQANVVRELLHEVLQAGPLGDSGETNRARLKTVRPSKFGPSSPQYAEFEFSGMVGGRGFEPGASRSRTGSMSCPLVSRRFLWCPPVLNLTHLRVLLCPSVSSWFRECVTQL